MSCLLGLGVLQLKFLQGTCQSPMGAALHSSNPEEPRCSHRAAMGRHRPGALRPSGATSPHSTRMSLETYTYAPRVIFSQVPWSCFHINPPGKGSQALTKATEVSLLLPLQPALRAPPQSKTKPQIWPRFPRLALHELLPMAHGMGSSTSCANLPEHQVCAQGGTKTLLPCILFPMLAHENKQINIVSTPAPDVPVFAPRS